MSLWKSDTCSELCLLCVAQITVLQDTLSHAALLLQTFSQDLVLHKPLCKRAKLSSSQPAGCKYRWPQAEQAAQQLLGEQRPLLSPCTMQTQPSIVTYLRPPDHGLLLPMPCVWLDFRRGFQVGTESESLGTW